MEDFAKTQFITQYTFRVDQSKPGRILETGKIGGVFVSRLTIDPGVVTGNLYHKETSAVLFVTKGVVHFRFKQVRTGEDRETALSPGSGIIHLPPYVAIGNKNITKEPAVVIFFSNKPFRSVDDYSFTVFPE